MVFEKIYKCLFIPNCTRKIMWLCFNNINEKIRGSFHSYAEEKRAHHVQNWFIQTLQVTSCVQSNQTRTIKTIRWNDIFTSLRRKKIQNRPNSSRNCSVCVRITFDEMESYFARLNRRINPLLHWITWKLHFLDQSELIFFFMYFIIAQIALHSVQLPL